MNKFFTFLFSFFIGFSAFAQIEFNQVAPNNSAQHLIENILVNTAQTGIPVSNVTVSCGDPQQYGFFSGANGDISMESGVYLASRDSGNITGSSFAPQPTDCANDVDLLGQLQNINSTSLIMRNEIIIEFDFVAAGNSVEFEYIFASHEYPQYVCSDYNDIFGFFISGPGISGPYSNNSVNMAKVPDPANPGSFTSTPVVINSINSGVAGTSGNPVTCSNIDANWTSYSVFFVNNNGGISTPNIDMDGFTVPLKAVSPVICGETYHLKIALADVGDPSLNSAVFLKAGSFAVVGGSTEQQSDFNLSDSILIEGCYPGEVIVTLDEFSTVAPTEILVDVTGTAQMGVDFDPIPDTLIIPPNTASGSIAVNTIVDNITENNESVIITTYICDNVLSRDTFIISDPDQIFVDIITGEDTLVCYNETNPVVVTAQGNGGYEPYSYNWYYDGNLQGGGATFGLNPQEEGAHIVEIVGDCGYTTTDTFWIGYLPQVPLASFTSFFDEETDYIEEGCEYGKLTITLPEVYAVDTTVHFQIVGGSATQSVDFYDFPMQITIPAGQLQASVNIEAIVDGAFEMDETIHLYMPFYDDCVTEPNPMELTIVSNPLLNIQLEDSMTVCRDEVVKFNPLVIGGVDPYKYTWSRGTNQEWTIKDLEEPVKETTTYYLTVEDICDEKVMDSITVYVPEYTPIEITSYLSSNISICKEDILDLEVNINGGIGELDYLWSKDGIPYSSKKELKFQDEDVAHSTYSLQVTDRCGNIGNTSFNVKVEHCEIPNVFTPNDDDLNDYFKFESRDIEGHIRISIFDRWGKEVFASNQYELCNNKDINCWDGMNNKTEKPAPEGVYYYVIDYQDGRSLKGSFHLMR